MKNNTSDNYFKMYFYQRKCYHEGCMNNTKQRRSCMIHHKGLFTQKLND